MFSIRVKELFEPTILKKKKRRVFALFKSIFLWYQYLSFARWFTVKNVQIGRGDLYCIKYWLSWNEKCCAVNNHNNYMCHICAKGFLDPNFNQAVIVKTLTFWKEIHWLFLPYKSYVKDIQRIYFFIFCCCEPLNCSITYLLYTYQLYIYLKLIEQT